MYRFGFIGFGPVTSLCQRVIRADNHRSSHWRPSPGRQEAAAGYSFVEQFPMGQARRGRWGCFLIPGVSIPLLAFAAGQEGIYGIGTASGDWVLLDPPGYDALKWERMAPAGRASTRIGAS